MVSADLSDLNKYPFLSGAGEYLRDTGFGWEEIDRPEWKHIIDRATERLEVGINGKIYYPPLEKREIEILTFLVSLLIVKSLGIEPVLKKFALAEARRAEKFLKEDLSKLSESRKRALFSKIFEDLFKLRIEMSDDRRLFKVRVVDYLTRTSHFHELEWKLINKLVHNGFVYLDVDETVRLIRNELSVLIYEKIKVMVIPRLPEVVKKKADELRGEFLNRYQSSFTMPAPAKYPPCIQHAIDAMSRGENLAHSARVMLATFMLATNKPIDEIVSMFENAPDFNEKITRYQVEHLAGLKGGHTKYSVPSCDKLRTENLCFATVECDGLINPIQFGRRKRN